MNPEVARKSVHVLLGAVCLAFPWWFDRPLPVWVLAGLASVPLLVLRAWPALRDGMGSVLHGVGRPSYGEVLFAPAVAAVFHLSGGGGVLYVVPVAILTLADAAGAVFGGRWGRHRYVCGGGKKSVEGSAIFAVAAFACALGPLLWSGTEPVKAVWIALTLAVLATMAEGISDRGFDNLVLPVGCHFLLVRLLESEVGGLVGRFVAAAGLLALVAGFSRSSTLSGSSLIGAALLGYGCAVLADWRFVMPLLGVFLCHVATSRRHDLTGKLEHRLDAVVSHAIPSLAWVLAVAGGWVEREVGLGGISCATAVQLAVAMAATRAWLGREVGWLGVTARGWVIGGLPGLVWVVMDLGRTWIWLAVAVLLTAWVCRMFVRFERQHPERVTQEWIGRGIVGLLVSLLVLGK